MTLRATVVRQRPDFSVEVDIRAEAGEVLALVGPNGAGKSTVLRVVAGLEPGDRGTSVAVDGRAVETLPAAQRRVTSLGADPLLFPHLTVLANVAFGVRDAGRRRDDRAREVLERLGVSDLADRRPAELSTGQAQRVGLARALATEPAALLLDEPLAALDAATRDTVRTTLRADLAGYGGSTVLVTHDPVDALALADQMCVLERGLVVQVGAPAEIARRPATDYVASLVGLNLLQGESYGRRVRLASGAELVVADDSVGPVHVAVAPSAVTVHRVRPEGSARNVFPGTVAGVEPRGSRTRVDVRGPVPLLADVTAEAVAALDLRPGVDVWVSVKAVETTVYARG